MRANTDGRDGRREGQTIGGMQEGRGGRVRQLGGREKGGEIRSEDGGRGGIGGICRRVKNYGKEDEEGRKGGR